MENIEFDKPSEKIVIGKTWFYVALIILGVILIFCYREHNKPLDPKTYKEPDSFR